MARLLLTPTRLVPGGASPANLTGLYTSLGSDTGVEWENTGHEILFIQVGTTPTNITSNIPLLIQGEAVAGQQASLAASTEYIAGPYPSQFDATDGTGYVTIDFSSETGVSVALIQVPGVT